MGSLSCGLLLIAVFCTFQLIEAVQVIQLRKDGNNVCATPTTKKEAYVSKYTYEKRVVKYNDCFDYKQNFLCKRTELVPVTIYKTKYRNVIVSKYDCCAGWRQDGDDCRTAICDNVCRNGGKCVKPNICSCKPGFMGAYCEVTMDRCQMDNGGCAEICIPLLGGYECRCKSGGLLRSDMHSCDHKVEGNIPIPEQVNVWTKNATGCDCYFDHSRSDCACCVDGGCQCTWIHPNKCVQCGYGHTCSEEYNEQLKQGVDGWTYSETGCACEDGATINCPCCQSGGCPCKSGNLSRCTQCGRPDVCGLI